MAMLTSARKAAIAFGCGVLLMFPAFTAVASDQLLEDFQYYDLPTTVSQNVAHALMEENAAIVIDVRSPEEYAEGHIAGAYNFPVETIAKHAADFQVVKDTNTPVLVYCRTGIRAASAVSALMDMDIKHLMNMGGVSSWEYGLTTEVPTTPFADAVKAVKPYKAQ